MANVSAPMACARVQVHKVWPSPELIQDVCKDGPPGTFKRVVMEDLSCLGYRLVSKLSPEEKAQAQQLALEALMRVPKGTGEGASSSGGQRLGLAQKRILKVIYAVCTHICVVYVVYTLRMVSTARMFWRLYARQIVQIYAESPLIRSHPQAHTAFIYV